jgi:hypothetical protein
MDFPQYGALNATPAEIYELATAGPQSLSSTVVQINHIGSHFNPLRIDTGVFPIQDGLSAAQRRALRLPQTGNLFHVFDALEIWNGSNRGAQREFLQDRMGIWFNHLNQGLPITFIADTDTHEYFGLRTAGARTWTPSSSDAPRWIEAIEIGAAVAAGRAVGGQGVYVQARLLADGGAAVADFDLYGQTLVAGPPGEPVELEIHVQAPTWAEYDRIEIYANAATTRGGSFNYGATPTRVLAKDVDFDVETVLLDPHVEGASRLETRVSESFDLGADTWFVVVVKGSDGISKPMFPVFASNLATASNATLDDLTDGNLGELGVTALGATNALYADVDGTPGFQIGP